MDYISIVFAAIGGGLGGLLGHLVSKNFSGKNAKTIAMVVPVLLLSKVSIELSKKPSIRDKIVQPSRIELLGRDSFDLIKNNKNYRKAVKGMSQKEVKLFTRQQTQKGLRRLPFEELSTWNDLRIRMASINKNICAGFWTGKITPQDLNHTFEALSDEELKTWLNLSMKAAILEVDQSHYTAPPQTALQTGIQLITSKMNKDDVLRLNNALQAGTNLKDEDACWTMMKILEKSKNFNKEEQENFFRALASL